MPAILHGAHHQVKFCPFQSWGSRYRTSQAVSHHAHTVPNGAAEPPQGCSATLLVSPMVSLLPQSGQWEHGVRPPKMCSICFSNSRRDENILGDAFYAEINPDTQIDTLEGMAPNVREANYRLWQQA